MKKLILSTIASIAMIFGLAGIATISPANAATYICPNGSPSTTGIAGCSELNSNNTYNNNDLMKNIQDIITFIVAMVGVIAVVMIVVGGINYTISQGDVAKVQKAQRTILYGVVGLVVAMLAYAIVNFVLSSLFAA